MPLSRSMIHVWPRDTFKDSREDATVHVRRLSRRCSTGARSTTLELHILVSPEVVKVCRYCVYCAGSPPPGIVSCAGLIIYTVLLGAFVVCIFKWHCVCRCTWWSCAGTMHSQFHMLYEHIFQVFRVMYDW